MSDPVETVRSWIGRRRYPTTSIKVEQSLVRSFCAAVQDGHAEYWRESVPSDPVRTPQAMLSVWMRPDPWSADGAVTVPLQTHFDIKDALGLPEAIIAEYSLSLGDPILIGDTLQVHESLKSISETKTTRLGVGRFWAVETVYERQNGVWAGSETYVAFGYRRPERQPPTAPVN